MNISFLMMSNFLTDQLKVLGQYKSKGISWRQEKEKLIECFQSRTRSVNTSDRKQKVRQLMNNIYNRQKSPTTTKRRSVSPKQKENPDGLSYIIQKYQRQFEQQYSNNNNSVIMCNNVLADQIIESFAQLKKQQTAKKNMVIHHQTQQSQKSVSVDNSAHKSNIMTRINNIKDMLDNVLPDDNIEFNIYQPQDSQDPIKMPVKKLKHPVFQVESIYQSEDEANQSCQQSKSVEIKQWIDQQLSTNYRENHSINQRIAKLKGIRSCATLDVGVQVDFIEPLITLVDIMPTDGLVLPQKCYTEMSSPHLPSAVFNLIPEIPKLHIASITQQQDLIIEEPIQEQEYEHEYEHQHEHQQLNCFQSGEPSKVQSLHSSQQNITVSAPQTHVQLTPQSQQSHQQSPQSDNFNQSQQPQSPQTHSIDQLPELISHKTSSTDQPICLQQSNPYIDMRIPTEIALQYSEDTANLRFNTSQSQAKIAEQQQTYKPESYAICDVHFEKEQTLNQSSFEQWLLSKSNIDGRNIVTLNCQSQILKNNKPTSPSRCDHSTQINKQELPQTDSDSDEEIAFIKKKQKSTSHQQGITSFFRRIQTLIKMNLVKSFYQIKEVKVNKKKQAIQSIGDILKTILEETGMETLRTLKQSNCINELSNKKVVDKPVDRVRQSSYYQKLSNQKCAAIATQEINDRIKVNFVQEMGLESPIQKNTDQADFHDYSTIQSNPLGPIAEPMEFQEVSVFKDTKRNTRASGTKKSLHQDYELFSNPTHSILTNHIAIQKARIGKKFQQIHYKTAGSQKGQKENLYLL